MDYFICANVTISFALNIRRKGKKINGVLSEYMARIKKTPPNTLLTFDVSLFSKSHLGARVQTYRLDCEGFAQQGL